MKSIFSGIFLSNVFVCGFVVVFYCCGGVCFFFSFLRLFCSKTLNVIA